jgi:hypothetical protein
MNSPNLYPSGKILKKMGLLNDQNGIIDRYFVESENWMSHLINTKNFISACLKDSGAKSVSILGSGWMLDIPQGLLVDTFETVVFYDIKHPYPIKHKYRKQKNFQFIEIDLTGGLLDKVFQIIKHKGKIDSDSLERELEVIPFKLPVSTEFSVSVNILNQLDILIIDYLTTRMEIPQESLNRIRYSIQQKHLNMLEPGKSLLISDFEEISVDTTGKELCRKPLIFAPLPVNSKKQEWIWRFDTQMNYRQNCNTYFNVLAILI